MSITFPVINDKGELIAVLDVDSEKAANFDESDRQYLEQITRNVFARCTMAPN